MNLFFGDSLTSGENNGFTGYVEYLEKLIGESCINLGVSGTCIGDYSLYPVGQTNLLQLLYKNEDTIRKADKIFLEYGANDISSICAGFTTLNVVEIELIKSLDFIRQLNNKAAIYFVTLGKNSWSMARGQSDYLNYDYLKYLKPQISDLEWDRKYHEFQLFIEHLPITFIEMPQLDKEEISDDNIHPNAAGYEKIAKKLSEVF